MTCDATAWFLYAGTGADHDRLAELVCERFELRAIAPGELLVEPLYGSWEGNMNHALERRPVDICKQRGEPRVIIGNTGVVRVAEVGRDVTGWQPGQVALLFSASVVDEWGYPEKALAYDAPGTMGCLSTKMIVRPHELVPVPRGTRYSLPQWAVFSGRYITAWSNWVQCYGTFRLAIPEPELPSPNVWGWGGGTTLAELDLARRAGCTTVMLSGDDRRLAAIARAGITPLDRRTFGHLAHDERRFAQDPEYRRAYLVAEAAFLAEVRQRTLGRGVQIFVDYIGTPVLRATLRALGRQGVITTAGWKEGMVVQHLRAVECIGRHQHVHTHYARYAQGLSAVAYGEREGWMPHLDEPIVPFERVPELARRFSAGEVGFFPVFSINSHPAA